MLNPVDGRVVRWAEDQKPLLIVTIDSEAEYVWNGASRQALGVRSASCQQRAQRIYHTPTCAPAYPSSSNLDGYEPIREIHGSLKPSCGPLH